MRRSARLRTIVMHLIVCVPAVPVITGQDDESLRAKVLKEEAVHDRIVSRWATAIPG
jgi:hypothetical protein